MSTFNCKHLTAVAAALAFAAAATCAHAQDTTSGTAGQQWQKDHPRRAQTNQRLENQNARVDAKVADGKMTQAQAAALHKDDHQIRQEERAMASQNGGHITKQERKTLNQQENKISSQIKSQ